MHGEYQGNRTTSLYRLPAKKEVEEEKSQLDKTFDEFTWE